MSDKGLGKAESYQGWRKLEAVMWCGAGTGEEKVGQNSQKVAFIWCVLRAHRNN